MRILVVRAGALGDFLLGIPALRLLRAAHPGAEIRLVGPLPQARLAAALVDSLIGVDEPALAPLFDGGSKRALPERLHGADLAVVWLSRHEEAATALSRHGVSRVISAPPLPPDGRGQHVADWSMESLVPAGIARDPDWEQTPWLAAGDAARAWAMQWQAAALGARPFAILHAGSGSRRKNWPVEQWAEAIGALSRDRCCNLEWVLTGGPADEEAVSAAQLAFAERHLRALTVTELSLESLAGLVARASLYLGNDSGVTHLAAGLGTPVVAVFGPTNPVYWRPRGPRVRVLGGNETAGPLLPLGSALAKWPTSPEVVQAAAALLTTQPEYTILPSKTV
jgi:ADP-heptose:LPS heptosyltransferase